MNPEDIKLSETRQAQKDRCCVFSFIRRSYSGVNVSEGGSREVATGGEEQRHKGWTLSTKMQSDRKPEP